MLKLVRLIGILLASLLLSFSQAVYSRGGLGVQLPGTQQQRVVDAELQRQQKERQLKAMEEKKQRSKDCSEDNTADSSLVTVPDGMKAEPQTSRDETMRDCDPEKSNKH